MSDGVWLEEIRAEERDSIERARECVRRKDPAGALTHLALAPYVPRDILAYVRGDRLPRARLERVLRWLTREELTTAREALDRGDYRAAKQACRAAWAMDRRGTLGAALTAMALLGQSGEAARRDPPAGPAELRDLLLQARQWVSAAAVDGSLRADVTRLAALVDDRLAEIDRSERRRDERTVDNLVGRYNTILNAYGRRITRTQAHNMRASLASLAVAVARSRERIPADSEQGPRLVDLARAIAFIQAQLASPV